jgi:endoglucanase
MHRWALGAEKYLDDSIGFFEALGWDWSYHAFCEWEG